jgi:SET domain-containing protein
MSLELRDSNIHGKGVFTTEHIRKHSVICRVEIIREITDQNPLDTDKGELFHHCHWYPDGTMVLLAEPYCYLNHSCQPNIFYYTVNRVTYCVAMRDIREDEELTLEYSLCNIGGEVWECKCGLPGCRGRHRCGFQHMDESRQMEYLPYLDPSIVEMHADSIKGILERQLQD